MTVKPYRIPCYTCFPLTTLLLTPPLSPPQAAIRALLCELESASCPVGPAPQRTAHYFSSALASRVRGDGLQRYLAELPPDPQAYEQAYMQYNVRTPSLHFLFQSCLASVSRALSLEYEAEVDNWLPQQVDHWLPGQPQQQQQPQPIERIHIIDTNVEFAIMWLQFIGQLADRPQGPPQSMRVTLLDVLPPVTASMSRSRRERALQLKEQLSVAALVAGIQEFECDVIVCCSSRIAEALARVKVRAGEREVRWRQTWSSRMYQACESQTDGNDGGYVSKRMRRMRGDSAKWQRPVPAGGGGAGGRRRGGHSGVAVAGAGGRPVVDFLAVISLMRLMELRPEPGPLGPSPRDVYLKVRALHSLHCPRPRF